ncbi:hypothetical protein ZWY2020_014681 [Hordeum vulgare]|nr:hypothetical protein ZWY2020_014681 [Hordeum vulgare]
MVSRILFQFFYGLLGNWTAYLISILYLEYRTRKEKDKVDFRNHVIQLIGCASNIYYVNDHLDKRTWTYIFGACCATIVFIPPSTTTASGFHQCMWGYHNLSVVEDVVENYRSAQIPLNVIWNDDDHMDARKDFTLSPVNYLRPKLLAFLDMLQFH